jgi:bifunctional enzyme CysN/CysC
MENAKRAGDRAFAQDVNMHGRDGALRIVVSGKVQAERDGFLDRFFAAVSPVSGSQRASSDELADGTIDTSWALFETAERSYAVAVESEAGLTSLAAHAGSADLAIIVTSATPDGLAAARHQAYLCSVFGLTRLICAVDAPAAAEFHASEHDLKSFAAKHGLTITVCPIDRRAAAAKPERLEPAWYTGPSLLAAIDTAAPRNSLSELPMRFIVERTARLDMNERGITGLVATGKVKPGDEVVVATTGRTSRVLRVLTTTEVAEAGPGETATLVLAVEQQVARGELLAHTSERPDVSDQFAAHVLWTGSEPMLAGRSYMLQIGARWTPASVTAIKHKVDEATLQPLAARTLHSGDVAVCNLSTALPVAFDAFADNRATGQFVLIDRLTNETVARGTIDFGLRRATNIHVEELIVDKAARAVAKRQQPTVIWFTGLSGSGKSTVAKQLEKRLHDLGNHTYVLDGDNVRHGLNRDLGFTDADRVENIRRIGEVAKLFADAGLVVLCSFISPFRAERRMVRELLAQDEFVEVYVDASIDECARRDPKGLYAKAKAGKIKNFTGIDSPYEPPEHAEIHLVTENVEPDVLVDEIIAHLREKGRI